MIPEKTTYTDYHDKMITYDKADGLNAILTNRGIVELTIGWGVHEVRCAGNQIKELYIPPHLKSIWLDHDQKITNWDEVMANDIDVTFVHFKTRGSGILGTNMLEMNLIMDRMSKRTF